MSRASSSRRWTHSAGVRPARAPGYGRCPAQAPSRPRASAAASASSAAASPSSSGRRVAHAGMGGRRPGAHLRGRLRRAPGPWRRCSPGDAPASSSTRTRACGQLVVDPCSGRRDGASGPSSSTLPAAVRRARCGSPPLRAAAAVSISSSAWSRPARSAAPGTADHSASTASRCCSCSAGAPRRRRAAWAASRAAPNAPGQVVALAGMVGALGRRAGAGRHGEVDRRSMRAAAPVPRAAGRPGPPRAAGRAGSGTAHRPRPRAGSGEPPRQGRLQVAGGQPVHRGDELVAHLSSGHGGDRAAPAALPATAARHG